MLLLKGVFGIWSGRSRFKGVFGILMGSVVLLLALGKVLMQIYLHEKFLLKGVYKPLDEVQFGLVIGKVLLLKGVYMDFYLLKLGPRWPQLFPPR